MEILSSEMALAEINKLNERKNAIATEIEEKRSKFNESDVETREAILTNEIPTLQSEAEDIDKQIAELEETRTKFEEQEKRMSLVKNVETEKVEARNEKTPIIDTPAYAEAWKRSVITGDEKEVKEMLKRDGGGGANLNTGTQDIPVPTIMQGYVETAWEKFGKFSRLVSNVSIKGYLSIPVELEADGAVWHDENAAAPAQEEITFGEILLQPKMIKKWISTTDELEALVPEEFMRYLADELVYRVVLELDEAIIRGNGDVNGKGVVGIIDNTYTAQVAQELNFNAINVAVGELKTFDNLIVAMNPKTFFNNVMGLVDTTERPIYQIAADNTGKPQYYINGLRVEFTNAISAYDNVADGGAWAVVGDFKGYKLNRPEGEAVKLIHDPYSLAEQDRQKYVARLFAAGNVTKLGYFAQLNKPNSDLGGD